jgi:tetratricopeptide (TPR) repeat protein
MQRPKKFRKKKSIIHKEVFKVPVDSFPPKTEPRLRLTQEELPENIAKASSIIKKGRVRYSNKTTLKTIYSYKRKSKTKNKIHLLEKIRSYLLIKSSFYSKIVTTVFIPHIYRIINAHLFRLGILTVFVSLLVFVTAINIFYSFSGFNEYKTEALLHYSDSKTHIKLATIFIENNDFEHAQQELTIARQLAPGDDNIRSELEFVSLLLSKPREIESEILKWEKITIEKPNYRDGFFRLAVLYYQTFNKDLAKKYVEKTLSLDPNFEPAKQFLELLSR